MGRKWKCVKSSRRYLTVGRIYEEDEKGCIKDNDGDLWNKGSKSTVAEWFDTMSYGAIKFVEVKDMSAKDNIQNGSMVKLDDGKFYIALIGGRYGNGFLHCISDTSGDYDTLNGIDEEQVEGVYEAKETYYGVSEMQQAARSDADLSSYFNCVYKKQEVKELTVAEIEKLLGYSVKIIKEEE